jgi:CubicO group peptidase (beta-lactamase class C family)
MHRPRFLLPDWSRGWGIGWWLDRADPRPIIAHGGATPGYRSMLMVDPARKLGIIVLINAQDGPHLRLADGMMRLLAGPIQKAAIPKAERLSPAADLARFEGLFRDRSNGYVRVVVLGGKLQMIALETDDVEAATTTLHQVGPTTFRTQVRDNVHMFNVEALVEFTMDASGRATEFTDEDGGWRYRRVE